MSDEQRTDEDLIEQFYGCDERAFDTLCHRWWPRLVAFFAWKFPSEEAEDLAQETFVKVFSTKAPTKSGYRRSKGPFACWICRIAYNVGVDALRARQRRPHGVPLDPDTLPSPESGPGLEPDFHDALSRCLRRLTWQEITVVTLAAGLLGDCTQRVIALQLGVADARVSAIKKAALGKLRACLEAQGYSGTRPPPAQHGEPAGGTPS